MKNTLLAATFSTMAMAEGASAQETITVNPVGSVPSMIADPENFSGNVFVDLLLPSDVTTPASSGLVNFAPGARTAWHTHPLGQMLIITAGKGWVQQEGQERQEVLPGEVVWIPAGIKHWHGGTVDNGMSHFAITYIEDGQNAAWMELVTDEDYLPE